MSRNAGRIHRLRKSYNESVLPSMRENMTMLIVRFDLTYEFKNFRSCKTHGYVMRRMQSYFWGAKLVELASTRTEDTDFAIYVEDPNLGGINLIAENIAKVLGFREIRHNRIQGNAIIIGKNLESLTEDQVSELKKIIDGMDPQLHITNGKSWSVSHFV